MSNVTTYKLFRELIRNKGVISRDNDSALWELVEDENAMLQLEEMGDELGFSIITTLNRVYLVPSMDNDIFLKGTLDFKNDIGNAYDYKNSDIALMSFLAIYILFCFFKGEGTDICVRNIMLKIDLLNEFDNFCHTIEEKAKEQELDYYGKYFLRLVSTWLQKTEGDSAQKTKDVKYGVLNKVLLKLKKENLIIEESDRIRVTNKAKDLMPYMLNKERIAIVNDLFEEYQEGDKEDA